MKTRAALFHAVGEPLDRADTAVGGMAETREAADAFTERELE